MHKEVQFTYHINSPGKASGELVVHDKKIPFQITNVSNPLYDLLKGMVSLVYEPSHLWDEENICWIDWYNETSGYKWIISTPDGKSLHIQIRYLADLFNEDSAQLMINTSCCFKTFYQAITQELDSFIKNMGLLNYEQLWQKDEFPLTYFLILKKHLTENGLWISNKEENSNFLDELNLLQA